MGEITDLFKQISLERDICKTQGYFYELAAIDGCDMSMFSDRYLRSRFCLRQMETRYSPYQREDARTCLEFIYPEIGGPESMPFMGKNEHIFNPDVAYWAGYTYYQLYCETGVHGKDLVSQVPFNSLIQNYKAHHTLDEIYSTDILCAYYRLEKDDAHRRYEELLEKIAEEV